MERRARPAATRRASPLSSPVARRAPRRRSAPAGTASRPGRRSRRSGPAVPSRGRRGGRRRPPAATRGPPRAPARGRLERGRVGEVCGRQLALEALEPLPVPPLGGAGVSRRSPVGRVLVVALERGGVGAGDGLALLVKLDDLNDLARGCLSTRLRRPHPRASAPRRGGARSSARPAEHRVEVGQVGVDQVPVGAEGEGRVVVAEHAAHRNDRHARSQEVGRAGVAQSVEGEPLEPGRGDGGLKHRAPERPVVPRPAAGGPVTPAGDAASGERDRWPSRAARSRVRVPAGRMKPRALWDSRQAHAHQRASRHYERTRVAAGLPDRTSPPCGEVVDARIVVEADRDPIRVRVPGPPGQPAG